MVVPARPRARWAWIVVLCILSVAAFGESKEWALGDKPSPPNAALLNGARAGEGEEALKKHLEFGATIDCKSEHGWTPMISAILHEKISTAQALVLSVCDFHGPSARSLCLGPCKPTSIF